jgi:hypothetical protein
MGRPPDMEGGPARHRPPEDPATPKRQARGDDNSDDGQDEVGFFRRAMAGKCRPAPREPQVTHYCCTDACCRSWSA